MPFAAAINHGVQMVMTSHILFPDIDPDRPATLSKIVTTDILRNRLGYNGVVVSDDIGMHAMDRFFR